MANDVKKCAGVANIICAICYEDVKPVIEDLQSISICGHVFHELCLQQWVEYCPSAKKASCPVCKCSCSGKDIHRLYFQSLADPFQRQCTPVDADSTNAEVLRENVKRLEGQLIVANSAFNTHQQQIKELDTQLSVSKKRAETAETARTKAVREKIQLEDVLKKKQEEIDKATAECSKLLDRSTALAKELAAHKLVANLDLEEDQVLKLASVGRGSNKDDVIDTLRKSLVIRNKSYKELMEKCNQLGIGESLSNRKLEKALAKIKKLKARIQLLEKTLEEKENAAIRNLAKAKKNFNGSELINLNSSSKEFGSKELYNSTNFDSYSNEHTSKFVSSAYKPVHRPFNNSAETLSKPKLEAEENGFYTSINQEKSTSDNFYEPVIKHADLDKEASSDKRDLSSAQDGRDQLTDARMRVDVRTAFNPDEHIASTSNCENEQAEEAFMGIMDDSTVLPIKKEGRVHTKSSVFTAHESMPGGSALLSGTSRTWCKTSPLDPRSKAPLPETLIAVGANGRGGQIKVLKSLHKPLVSRASLPLFRESKRLKTNGRKSVPTNTGAALSIDHFFHKKSHQ